MRSNKALSSLLKRLYLHKTLNHCAELELNSAQNTALSLTGINITDACKQRLCESVEIHPSLSINLSSTNGNLKAEGFPWLEIKSFMLITVIAHSKTCAAVRAKYYKTAIKYSCKL